MKPFDSILQVPYHFLIDYFLKSSDQKMHIHPGLGDGSVQVFKLEGGLQARIWECSFSKGLKLFSYSDLVTPPDYYTLAYFPAVKGIQLIDAASGLPYEPSWDRLFLSAASDYQLHILPNTKFSCLSISFSKKWLTKVVGGNPCLEYVHNLLRSDRMTFAETVSAAEKLWLAETIKASAHTVCKTFFIKSAALKVITSVFEKFSRNPDFLTSTQSCQTQMNQVEQLLISKVQDPLPNLKELAQQFFMSESTLKRKFKQRFGLSMSVYFLQKKMEYAHQLISVGGKSICEAAKTLGYKSVTNFKIMFNKYDRYNKQNASDLKVANHSGASTYKV